MRSSGKISSMAVLFVLSLIALAGLSISLLINRHPQNTGTTPAKTEPLLVYCAVAVKIPLEQAARDYEKEFGVHVEAQFGASNTLLTSAQASGKGDLFLPADDSYLHIGHDHGTVDDILPIASIRPVIAVPKGNPRHIKSLDDLLADDVNIAQANPDAAAIGKVSKAALEKAGYWSKLEPRTRTFTGTVNEVANAVNLGTVDAGIVWDTTVRQVAGLDAVQVPQFDSVEGKISVGILHSSKQPAEAANFARYLTASDRGLKIFAREGYATVKGEAFKSDTRVTTPSTLPG